MHYLVLLLTIIVALAAATPIDRSHQVVNRPWLGIFPRVKRSDAKGHVYSQGRVPLTKTGHLPMLQKGEYYCGNKVCKLKPGEKPPCELCQYPIV